MGLGPKFIPSLSMGQQPLNDQRNGPYFSPILSGPSTYEVGECSKAGQASLVPKLAVARQRSRIPERRAILISDGVSLWFDADNEGARSIDFVVGVFFSD